MANTKFSIIIVAYNIENFIEQAMLSCVFPGREDYEVIVVENRSEDRTLEFANRVAAQNSGIFRIIENEQNFGLGIGRNIGMKDATGDYILFLDGDDWFSPELLDRLAPLIEMHASDTFVFNHARAFDNGKIVQNKLTKILYPGPRDTIAKRAEVMQNFGVAWNKAYKRSFIEARGLKFGERFYEDIDWNFEVALLSKTFYALPDVLVYYRQRTGSITRSVDIRHFDILSQYSVVVDFLRRHPDLIPHYGAKIYRYARNQCLHVLTSDRLPDGSHTEFLHKLADLLEAFRSTVGLSKTTYGEKLVGTRNLSFFRYGQKAIKAYDKAETRIKKIVEPLRKKIASIKAARDKKDYRTTFQKRPINNRLVLLEAFWGKKIDCNPYALALALEKHGYQCVWSLHKGGEIPSGYKPKTVRKNSREYLELLATAKYLISNANLPDYWIKRDGQVHIQTFHGTPLKFMGLDIIKTNPKEMNWSAYATRSQRWDFAVSSNEFSTRVWRQNAPYHYKVIESGYPRNDIFFRGTPELVDRIRTDLGIPKGKKVALYAPTFREPDKDKKKNFAQSETFDADAVQRALGVEWVLLVRGHYFVTSTSKAANPSVIDASNYVVTNEVCLISDLLITDYSSIMFDYACLGRPIVLYTYDFEAYVKTRGMYFDIRTEGPGEVVEQFEDLSDVLSEKRYLSEQNARKLSDFKKRFTAFEDGRAAERVLESALDIPGTEVTKLIGLQRTGT